MCLRSNQVGLLIGEVLLVDRRNDRAGLVLKIVRQLPQTCRSSTCGLDNVKCDGNDGRRVHGEIAGQLAVSNRYSISVRL
jgi:hypothetical protein